MLLYITDELVISSEAIASVRRVTNTYVRFNLTIDYVEVSLFGGKTISLPEGISVKDFTDFVEQAEDNGWHNDYQNYVKNIRK